MIGGTEFGQVVRQFDYATMRKVIFYLSIVIFNLHMCYVSAFLSHAEVEVNGPNEVLSLVWTY